MCLAMFFIFYMVAAVVPWLVWSMLLMGIACYTDIERPHILCGKLCVLPWIAAFDVGLFAWNELHDERYTVTHVLGRYFGRKHKTPRSYVYMEPFPQMEAIIVAV